MRMFLILFGGSLAALAVLSWLRGAADSRAPERQRLNLLPGDIKYQSPNGNVRIEFPIVTSLVLSVVLTLLLRRFG